MIHSQANRFDSSFKLINHTFFSFINQCLALLCLWLVTASFQNAIAAQVEAKSPSLFAVVYRIDGEITAVNAAGSRLLHLGDKVLTGERISAASSSEGVLKTLDGGYVAIRPGAEFIAERFAAEGKSSDHSNLNLIKGALRIISGWIGKINQKGSLVSTATATVGIRGTDHEPYVLLDDDPATNRFHPGTYDKVNQGGTTLTAAGQAVDIDPGKVGFARSQRKHRERALMTLLFPVLLDKVPEFYVPGKFDAEMDELSKSAKSSNLRELQAMRKKVAACVPGEVAASWIKKLDQHIVSRQAEPISAMFGENVRIKATVRDANGNMNELYIERSDFVQSITASVNSLKNYKHRRISIEGNPAEASQQACAPIRVKSIVIEEGRQAGKPYRFESEEIYLLEQFDGQWLAVEAETTQR